MHVSPYAITQPLIFGEMMKGKVYMLSGDFTLAASTSSYFHIKTGNSNILICDVEVSVDGAEVLVEGYAESTVSADGTPVTLAATNRVVNGQPLNTKIFSSPTITDEGNSVIHKVAYGDTAFFTTRLADTRSGRFYLVKENTSNLFKMTNRDGTASAKINYNLAFIEAEA